MSKNSKIISTDFTVLQHCLTLCWVINKMTKFIVYFPSTTQMVVLLESARRYYTVFHVTLGQSSLPADFGLIAFDTTVRLVNFLFI